MCHLGETYYVFVYIIFNKFLVLMNSCFGASWFQGPVIKNQQPSGWRDASSGVWTIPCFTPNAEIENLTESMESGEQKQERNCNPNFAYYKQCKQVQHGIIPENESIQWQPVAWKTQWQKEQLQLYCQWSATGKCWQALSRSLQTVALEVVQTSKVQQSERMEVQFCWMQCFLWYPYFGVWPCESKKNNVQKR